MKKKKVTFAVHSARLVIIALETCALYQSHLEVLAITRVLYFRLTKRMVNDLWSLGCSAGPHVIAFVL